MLRRLGPAFLLYLSACLGETGVAFNGTVTTAEPGYSFDDTANPAGNPPIEGADVELYVNPSSSDCATVATEEATRVRTDSTGAFSVETVAGVGCEDELPVLLCIRAPNHETFQYTANRLDTSDPMAGQKQMNVRLAPTP